MIRLNRGRQLRALVDLWSSVLMLIVSDESSQFLLLAAAAAADEVAALAAAADWTAGGLAGRAPATLALLPAELTLWAVLLARCVRNEVNFHDLVDDDPVLI